MSRAFVREDDQERHEDVPEIRIPLPQGARNYMTPAGAEQLQNELHELVSSERPKLTARVARLAIGGDGSDADGSRLRLRKIDRRVEYLSRMAALLEVIDPAQQSSDKIMFGATVVVSDTRESQRTYKIVGVDESNPEQGKISWASPVARALVGARVDDDVTVALPGGESHLKVNKIDYR